MSEKSRFGGLSAAQLRLIAMGLMLLDHLWATVVPGNLWMTCLGRLAFPIFAFQIAEGYAHTSDLGRYKKRLLLWALLSELPFNLMFGSWFYPFHQNVLFTFLLGLVAIEAVEKGKREEAALKSWFFSIAVPFGCLALAAVGFVDYSWMGVATVLGFHLLRGSKLGQLALLIVLNQFCIEGQGFELLGGAFFLQLQAFAVLALPLIWLYNGQKGRGPNVGYWFYPLHMLILGLAGQFL